MITFIFPILEWSNPSARIPKLSNSRAHVLKLEWSSSTALNAALFNFSAHIVNLELCNSNPSIFNWELSSSRHPLLTHWNM